MGENETIFRAVNEEVRSRIPTFQIARGEYERVRADSALFVIRPGHGTEDTEHVVSETNGYWVVRKAPGLPERPARATDVGAA